MSRGPANLFVSCLVDLVRPEAGEAAVRVLRRCGYEVRFPPGQTCCGQPAWNTGFPAEARRVATPTLHALARSEGLIVGLTGSCVATVGHVWPELFGDDPALLAAARDVGERMVEFGALLAPLAPAEPAEAPQDAAPVAFHCSCHQRRGLRDTHSGAALLDALPRVERREVAHDEVCCGFGGTFSVSFGALSGSMGRDRARWTRESGARTLVSSDLGCLLHVGGCAREAGEPLETLTLAELLDREGFAP